MTFPTFHHAVVCYRVPGNRAGNVPRPLFWEECMTLFRLTVALGFALGATLATPALAQKKYDTGASDTEIKVGQTIPLSGPASAYGSIGKVQAAYIRMINEQGGINGRKVNLIQYDDAYSPPKTVEQGRKLVESDA